MKTWVGLVILGGMVYLGTTLLNAPPQQAKTTPLTKQQLLAQHENVARISCQSSIRDSVKYPDEVTFRTVVSVFKEQRWIISTSGTMRNDMELDAPYQASCWANEQGSVLNVAINKKWPSAPEPLAPRTAHR